MGMPRYLSDLRAGDTILARDSLSKYVVLGRKDGRVQTKHLGKEQDWVLSVLWAFSRNRQWKLERDGQVYDLPAEIGPHEAEVVE